MRLEKSTRCFRIEMYERRNTDRIHRTIYTVPPTNMYHRQASNLSVFVGTACCTVWIIAPTTHGYDSAIRTYVRLVFLATLLSPNLAHFFSTRRRSANLLPVWNCSLFLSHYSATRMTGAAPWLSVCWRRVMLLL